MKYLFITDLHFGIYKDIGLLKYQFETLDKIIKEENPDGIIIGGDIFHYKSPRIETILEVRDWIYSVSNKIDDYEFYLLRGNHDTLSKSPNSRHLLEFFEGVTVISDPSYYSLVGSDDSPDMLSTAFIPHYYDSSTIVDWWQKTGRYQQYKYIFGHWAYKGVMAHHDVEFSDTIDLNLFKNQEDCHIFLGHIHEPQDRGNVHVVGTQYSISFGEANQDKRYLIIDDDGFHFKPVTHGIKHLKGNFSEVCDMVDKYQKDFKLLCRVMVKELDSAYTQDIKDYLLKEKNVILVDVRVVPENVTPNKTSIKDPTAIITDEVINEYVENNPIEGFEVEEIMGKYKEILNEAKEISS